MKIICNNGEGREPNPHQQNFWYDKNTFTGHVNPEWTDFDKSHPVLPVYDQSGKLFTGSGEVEAKVITQAKVGDNWILEDDAPFRIEGWWDTREVYVISDHIEPTDQKKEEIKTSKMEDNGTTIICGEICGCPDQSKCSLKPCKKMEVDFTEFQVQLRCCLIIKDGFDNEWMKDFYEDYKEDFGVKLTVKEWAEDFFQDVTLNTHSYCLVSKVGKHSEKLEPGEEESVEEAAQNHADGVYLSLRHDNPGRDRITSSAKFDFECGAKWQKSQTNLIEKEKVIELLEAEMAEADKKYLHKLDNLITKVKSL